MIGLILLLISGCSLIESDAGKSHYVYRVTTPDGVTHEIDLSNAKDVGVVRVKARFGDVEVELYEEGVNASGAMTSVAEKNATIAQKLIDLIPAKP